MGENRYILPSIFAASFSCLSFEITLTRIFSFSLWYHFAFMVISIAMLGIGASGTILSVSSRLKDIRYLQIYCVLFSAAMPASYLLLNLVPFDPAKLAWDRSQMLYIGIYYLVLSIPFFFFGMIVTTAFSSSGFPPGKIYGADLMGGGAGSLGTLLFLSLGPPEKIIFAIASVSALSWAFYGRKNVRVAALLLVFINSAALYFYPPFVHPRISPYKPLASALRYPGARHLETFYGSFCRIDLFQSAAARYAPGLSLKYLEELPEQIGLAVDAEETYAVTRGAGDRSFIRYLPSSLPYELSPKESVLILEPKGGLPVLTAEYYGVGDIQKIDSNPLLIKTVREYLGTFSSGIYEKNAHSGMGRIRLASSPRKFDLIEISMTGFLPSGLFGFSEDYRFTVEAFEEYLMHLQPDGQLAITLYIIPPPRTELRFLSTLAAASERQGLHNFAGSIAAIRSWDTITMIFKKSGLSPQDLTRIRDFSIERRFDLVYAPGIAETDTNVFIRMYPNYYFSAFRDLTVRETREGFMKNYMFDVRPVYDENPFFHYFLKLGNLRETYQLMGKKWQYFLEEGYLLPLIFVQVLGISVLLMLLPAALAKAGNSHARSRRLFLPLAYFSLLGAGFMFIEISFIQKMILPLENPSHAVSAVLSSMLIGCGAGSLLNSRFRVFRKPSLLFFLSLTIVCYIIFLPGMVGSLYPHSLPARFVLVFLILMPVCILMGMPFPLGLSLLGDKDPSLIPWAWAVNGCFSVLSPLLAFMFALSAGFKIVILAGFFMYLLAFFSLRSAQKVPSLR